ncbi:MAG: type IV pilus twitching motility protein PilT [Armatimonadetes bacterium]|nr:type IV pilus twitching motility protein PilT [Armatimonadota bacterium]
MDRLSGIKGLSERIAALEQKPDAPAQIAPAIDSELRERVRLLEQRLDAQTPPGDNGQRPVQAESAPTRAESTFPFELRDILKVVIKHNASDLHLKAGSRPTVRLNGELLPLGKQVLVEEDVCKLVLSSMPPPVHEKFRKGREVDYGYASGDTRFRVNAFLERGAMSATFRVLRTDIPDAESLGLPPVVRKLADHHHGLILVTGPAGSGKSTTLAAMIEHINSTRKMHIVTLEDPIEFLHQDRKSIITQREIGTDTETFSTALKHALRQDPNVILIGEMRDPETIMTAAIAAETGHLVLSTLHTPSAIGAIDRMVDVFSGDQQKQFRLLLATTLRGVISQHLLRRADTEGRIPAVEVLVMTPTIRSLIAEGKSADIYPLMVQGNLEGMQTFTQSLTRLYQAGLVTKEEALFYSEHPTEFRLEVEGHLTGTKIQSSEDALINWL